MQHLKKNIAWEGFDTLVSPSPVSTPLNQRTIMNVNLCTLYLHVTRRTTVQKAVVVVNAAQGSRRGHRPTTGAVIRATDSAAEKSRLPASAVQTAVQSSRITQARVVLIRPRRRRRCPRFPGTVQTKCVGSALKIRQMSILKTQSD